LVEWALHFLGTDKGVHRGGLLREDEEEGGEEEEGEEEEGAVVVLVGRHGFPAC